MSKEREETLNEIKEKYKIALFMVIRNSQVMPVGMELGKSKKEINKKAYETMCEVISMIDYDNARKEYEEGKE